jgi:hypothetical protein
MLYLKASSDIEILDQYRGEKGVFIKTFAFNDQRNKNGWRVTWDSIKAYIATFEENQRPGIEFVKCDGTICDLDHTDGATFAQSLKVQEPFRVTTIVGHTLDETTHTAYFIHKLHDESFLPKIQNGEVKFVSPSIWPRPGGYAILGKMPNGLPMIDVYEWDGVHDAFLTKDPAFGDAATITAVCEGDGCMMRLMTASELKANDLDPLKQVSILVRHKNKLHFVTIPQEKAKQIQALYDENSSVDANKIISVLKSNNSFSACACSALQMDAKEYEEKIAKMQKAMEDKEKEHEKKVKELESKLSGQVTAQKAHIVSALKAMTENDRADYIKQLKASSTDAKLIEDVEAEVKAFKAKEEPPKDDPRIKALEAKLAEPMIEKMLAARKENGMPEDDIKTFEKALRAKSYSQIEEQFNSEQIYLKNFKAKEEEKVHFEFPGTGSSTGALTGKTLEEIREVPQ